MDKKELLRTIDQLERKFEKSKLLFYQKTDSLIEKVNKTDHEDVIEECQKEIQSIYKAFDNFLETLKIE